MVVFAYNISARKVKIEESLAYTVSQFSMLAFWDSERLCMKK